MKFTFYKIASPFLALLVLFSTFSFTVEKHYCGDFLIDVSYFGAAQHCAGELGEDDCDSLQVIKKKKCCKDEVQSIEGQDNLRNSLEKLALEKQQFAVAYIASFINLFASEQQQEKAYLQYVPPELIKKLQVLHEVFII